VSLSSSKEALVEEELYHLIRVILDKHGSKLDGVEFGKVQPQHSVDGGVADLVLPFADGGHFLVIECKRKISKPSGTQTIRDFDIFGSNVLNQTLNYAMRLGTLAFATTNGSRLALFRTPKAGEPFRIDTHRLLVQDPFKLEEKYVEELLEFLSKWHKGIPVRLVEIDWFFISRLRSFVDFLSKSLIPVIRKLASDKATSQKFVEFSERIGGVTIEQLSRETAYLLMNKIIFYKILERHYKRLSKLKPIAAPDGEYFVKFLKGYFEKAIQVTGDFEPIFITDFYDEIPLPDVDFVLDEVNGFIEEMDTYRLEEVGSDVVGYIYEELLPDEERHRLGQFYTPPPIAELIVKWALRKPTDRLLDPATGSGTFQVKAYQRLLELKKEQKRKTRETLDSGAIHKEILSQLYADDINPFPAHLTSMNLAMRNVKHPTSEMNIIVEDFFNLGSRMDVLTPHVVKTPKGEIRRHIAIPDFNAVVANPPYTRWTEISSKTQKSINRSIESLVKKYKLSGGIGKEIGIYVPFIMHAHSFLKKKGRIGMIIPNSWLQSDYGINFANFLLDNFKVKAVIDFNQRLFRIPLIATCVILLEKEGDKKIRNENMTLFLYIEKEAKVEELLDALENPGGWKKKFIINIVKQSALSRKEKWIKSLFNISEIEGSVLSSPFICKMEDLFEARHGNVTGIFPRGGTGSNAFFYLTKEDVSKWGLEKFVHPLLASSRYLKSFELKKTDWKELENKKKLSYVFLAHKPFSDLPENVKRYIQNGQTGTITKSGKTSDQSISSQVRSKSKLFCGWYDLGEVINTNIFVPYYARYKQRFSLVDFPVVFDADFICFVPKKQTKLSKEEQKAILAFLNSNFVQLFVETNGRVPGGLGPVAIEKNQASQIPVLNINKLTKAQVATLAELFDKLELESRSLGGSGLKENVEKLRPVFGLIDEEIIRILDLKLSSTKDWSELAKLLAERRLSRTDKAKPRTVMGEETPTISPPEKYHKREEDFSRKLTDWTSPSSE
jgi:type I restriction-modification system DNA methylase subunit